MTSVPSASLRRAASIAVVWFVGSGCVYYNGIYNAKAAAHRGDLQVRADGEGDASQHYRLSAEKAESVLVRYPKSTWRVQALYLAGRGEAFSGQCERALVRLAAYLEVADGAAHDDDRVRARVAIAACELQTQHVVAARARLDSLVGTRDVQTARQARLWAARAALADGDRDAAADYLGGEASTALSWELLTASLSGGDFARAESLLVARAERTEYKDDVVASLRQLWSAGRHDAVERVVTRYDQSGLRDANRATLHYAVGDLRLRAGHDSAARRHLLLARTLAGRDSTVEHEAAARLWLLGVPSVSSVSGLDSVFAVRDSALARTAYVRRVSEHVLLFRLLLAQPDEDRAALFLAAEVSRDSLRAPALARTLFVRLATESPASMLAARAWYAAALLLPDSASVWNARVLSRYGSSSVARWLRGEDPAASVDYASSAEALRLQWDLVVRSWSDSVRRLRVTSTSAPKGVKP